MDRQISLLEAEVSEGITDVDLSGIVIGVRVDELAVHFSTMLVSYQEPVDLPRHKSITIVSEAADCATVSSLNLKTVSARVNLVEAG